MKVWKDILNGNEIVSDSYKHEVTFDGACLEVRSKLVTKGAEDFGIADNSEEGGAGGAEGGVSVIDVVDGMRLEEIEFDKKSFTAYIKGYMKSVKEKVAVSNPDRVGAFQKSATEMVKFILGKFDEFQIFRASDDLDMEGAFAYAFQKNQEDEGPTFMFFLDGLKEEKF